MHFWNDYEGQTIAEAYPLEKLLRPEGRSAFFVTKNGTGTPNVIRLTESLNDEHEILERWRQVSEVKQENLVAIKSFGQTTFDGVPLAYALMEPTDSNLAEILAERPLTVAETVEVASSLVAALMALHGSGLIHQHLEPANVLASGEVIKLRSDCVRECVVDGEFTTAAMCAEGKHKDVQDLAGLLVRCLTLEKTLAQGARLGVPFDRIVPKGLDGSWGLAEIDAALHPPVDKPLVPESFPQVRSLGTGGIQALAPVTLATSENLLASAAAPVQAALNFEDAGQPMPVRRMEPEAPESTPVIPKRWIVGGGVAVLVALLVWMLIPNKSSAPVPAARMATIADAPEAKAQARPSAAQTAVVSTAEKRVKAAAPANARSASASATGNSGWRAVCYTFSHEDQAWARAGAIHKVHPGLHPQVFAVSAKGPYLITLGGVMTRAEANTVVRRARGDGLPRDTFARFYPAR